MPSVAPWEGFHDHATSGTHSSSVMSRSVAFFFCSIVLLIVFSLPTQIRGGSSSEVSSDPLPRQWRGILSVAVVIMAETISIACCRALAEVLVTQTTRRVDLVRRIGRSVSEQPLDGTAKGVVLAAFLITSMAF